jgi:DNA repair protein RadD
MDLRVYIFVRIRMNLIANSLRQMKMLFIVDLSMIQPLINLFKHQTDVISDAYILLRQRLRNILIVLPTGAGKTIVKAQFAKDAFEQQKMTLVFAHRDVLLVQISLALGMLRVPHSFIVSKPTRTYITNLHIEKFGKSYWVETSPIIVVSVDAFLARLKKGTITSLLSQVRFWMMDEAHHTLKDNKWGRCIESLTRAHGIGFTATPCRGDRKGLGSHADGVFDDLIVGATMGQLIKLNRLSPYKIFSPPTRVDVTGLKLNKQGDWNSDQLAKRTDHKDITGDAVLHYQRHAAGKKAITFTCNIAHSIHVAKQFNDAGIPSRAISSKNSNSERQNALDDFNAGRIMNLVNCDLFGEGFDVPSVEVCIMLRKTESYSLFKQQFGRCLRVIAGKLFGILLDHVGNVQRHCLLLAPHEDPMWSLDRESSKQSSVVDEPIGRVCPQIDCRLFYIPFKGDRTCPNCGHTETRLEMIAHDQDWQEEKGDLIEMNIDFIDLLLAERNHVDKPINQIRDEVSYASAVVKNSIASNHLKRQYAQNLLREEMQEWCVCKGIQELWDIRTTQREFELRFGINLLRAQVLSERKALELLEKIKHDDD